MARSAAPTRSLRHPDRENRASPDIDAYAESQGLSPLAIEHTAVQSLAEQIRDSSRFAQALVPLESELASAFPFWLALVLPYRNVQTGSDWATIRGCIRAWVLANAGALPIGRTTRDIPGVPFPLTFWKRLTGGPGIFLVREVPSGNRNELLLAEMRKALDHSCSKLSKYHAQGATGVVVLESDNIALVDAGDLYRAFLLATRDQPRPDLDQIWLVSPWGVYCFNGPLAVMTAVNPANFRFGPEFVNEWLRPTADANSP
jgi:hypothetical protein